MKKIFVVGVISILLLTSFGSIINADEQNTSDKIISIYSFKSPVFSKVYIDNIFYDRINIIDTICDGNAGEPLLPAKGVSILLPPNSKITNIVVNSGMKINLGSGYLIEPAAESVPLSETYNMQMPVADKEIYSSTEIYPGKLFSEIGTYSCRGYDILVLMLHPVQYVPASGDLFYYPDLTVNVEIVKEIKDNSLFRGSSDDNKYVIGKVDNPSISNIYMKEMNFDNSSSNYDLLIITSNSLKSGFEPLKEAHEDEGLSTLIYTVEDIYNNYTGVDNAEKIRNFIKDAYNDWGIEYVLLGGDSDIIPARCLFGGYLIGNVASDLYYSCLNGNWNSPETPNPLDKDISNIDPGVNVSCSNLTGPITDYTNYLVGNSSMRFNCLNGGKFGIINIGFDNPIDISKENYIRFSINCSQDDFIGKDLGYFYLVIYDDKGLERSTFYSNSQLNYSWEDINTLIKLEGVGQFNFNKVVKISLLLRFNSSKTITEEDFIRLDGIYFSDSVDFLWGEQGDDDDLLAEVYVGRACVDNLSDVQNFTSKTISYMNTNNEDLYLKNVTMVGQYMGSGTFFGGKGGGYHMDELIGKCFKHSYVTQGFPQNKFKIEKLYDRYWIKNGWPKPDNGIGGWPKELLINIINQGTHIINHLGHSNNFFSMKMNNSDIINLDNQKLCFIYSQGCYAGGFNNIDAYGNYHEEDCIAEYFTVKTDKGAFAGIWNSGFGVGNRFSTNGPSQRYQRMFWDAVFSNNITIISKANQFSKEENICSINNSNMRGVYYELNLFGDPALSFKYLSSSLTNSQSQSKFNGFNDLRTLLNTLYLKILEKFPHSFSLLRRLIGLYT